MRCFGLSIFTFLGVIGVIEFFHFWNLEFLGFRALGSRILVAFRFLRFKVLRVFWV